MIEDRVALRKEVVSNFELWKTLSDAGEIDRAFACLIEGNRLRKTELPFDIAEDEALFDRIKGAFSHDVPEVPGGIKTGEITPVFILGMPRSGTTLVEQILASHSQVHGSGELLFMNEGVEKLGPVFSIEQLGRLRRDYLSALSALNKEKRFITDKMPLNFKWIGFILSALPEAKIIYVKRDPRATCFSIFKKLFTFDGNQFSYDLQDVARYYNLHMDLMRFWHRRFPSRIYDLNYETLTEHQTRETRRLLEYVGLDWEERCLEFYNTERHISTASATQVRQKMYQNSSNAWRAYKAHLGPMLTILGAAALPCEHRRSTPSRQQDYA